MVDEKIFCVHAGISPELNTPQQINNVMRPTDVPDSGARLPARPAATTATATATATATTTATAAVQVLDPANLRRLAGSGSNTGEPEERFLRRAIRQTASGVKEGRPATRRRVCDASVTRPGDGRL